MTDVNAEAKEKQAKSAEDKAKAVEDAYANQGTPTPTQEENDIVALGGSVDPHADDGSGPPPEMRTMSRQSEPAKQTGGGYQTRTAAPSRDTSKDHQNHKDQQPKDHAAGKSQS